MNDENGTAEGGSDTTVSKADYDRQLEVNNTLKGKLTDFEKRFEAFDGLDIDKLKADAQALKDLQVEQAKGGGQEDIDALISDRETAVRSELQGNIDTLTGDLSAAKDKIRELTIVDKGFAKVSELFNSDTHEFIKDIIRQTVDIDDQGGFVVKDKDGNTRYEQGSANKALSLDAYGKELAELYPSFAKATVSSGSRNGTPQASGNTSSDVARFLAMTPEQRAALPAAEHRKLSVAAVKG